MLSDSGEKHKLNMDANKIKPLQNAVICAIMDLTDKQAEYVLTQLPRILKDLNSK
jgi:hypothetical protein